MGPAIFHSHKSDRGREFFIKMADFDQFASAEPTGQEEDPAAAFLAREQDQLASLEDDTFGVSDGQASQDAFASQPAQDGGEFFGSGENNQQPSGGDNVGLDLLSSSDGPPPTDMVEESPESSDPFGLGA